MKSGKFKISQESFKPYLKNLKHQLETVHLMKGFLPAWRKMSGCVSSFLSINLGNSRVKQFL